MHARDDKDAQEGGGEAGSQGNLDFLFIKNKKKKKKKKKGRPLGKEQFNEFNISLFSLRSRPKPVWEFFEGKFTTTVWILLFFGLFLFSSLRLSGCVQVSALLHIASSIFLFLEGSILVLVSVTSRVEKESKLLQNDFQPQDCSAIFRKQPPRHSAHHPSQRKGKFFPL
jgi:hypothetical protein